MKSQKGEVSDCFRLCCICSRSCYVGFYNGIETYTVVTGAWNLVKENGEAMGAGLYIALLVVGAVLLIGGIVCIVIGAKKNKK